MTATDTAPIYLDYAATTPVAPEVVQAMLPYLTECYGNAASRTHAWGWQAERAVEAAREQVAALVGAEPKEIIWTSGATESDNLAITGAARFHRQRGDHLVTVATEHKAVLDPMRELEREGFTVTFLAPEPNGLVDPAAFAAALGPRTVLASVMLVNNEIGVIQDIAALGEICRERGVLLHVDAAQAVGKVPIDLARLPVDLMSFSAHKVYGPKGVGALYVRRRPRVRLAPLIHGGGHERGLRSGTLPTHQLVGMGAAYRLAGELMAAENARIGALHRRFLAAIADIEETYLNGDAEARVPHNLNVSFNFVEGESLLMAVRELAVSSGSACTSASLEPSHVLRALGRSDELAHSSLRISLGRYTTEQEVDRAAALLRDRVARLRALSPLWDMHLQGIDLNTVQWAAAH
ncbi:MAG TPA: IscS subfamily cysteine desulfurase [Gammaproteobacteria bacterium]|nr:IscS subfamily cysteine desulfurase [Gammaproteobacteria bacterium]